MGSDLYQWMMSGASGPSSVVCDKHRVELKCPQCLAASQAEQIEALEAQLGEAQKELHQWRNGHHLGGLAADLSAMHCRALDAEKRVDAAKVRGQELEALARKVERERDRLREQLSLRDRELDSLAKILKPEGDQSLEDAARWWVQQADEDENGRKASDALEHANDMEAAFVAADLRATYSEAESERLRGALEKAEEATGDCGDCRVVARLVRAALDVTP